MGVRQLVAWPSSAPGGRGTPSVTGPWPRTLARPRPEGTKAGSREGSTGRGKGSGVGTAPEKLGNAWPTTDLGRCFQGCLCGPESGHRASFRMRARDGPEDTLSAQERGRGKGGASPGREQVAKGGSFGASLPQPTTGGSGTRLARQDTD